MTNEAKKWVAKFQDQPDSENYNWLYDKNDKVIFVPYRLVTTDINYEGVRYEFEDGSAIVNYECGWDFGIHTTNFKNKDVLEACREYDLEVDFAWCNVVNLDEKFQNRL